MENVTDQIMFLGEVEIPQLSRAAGLVDHEQSLHFPLGYWEAI